MTTVYFEPPSAGPGSARIASRKNRVFATLITIVVCSNRFLVRPQLFYNDFAVLALCLVVVMAYGFSSNRDSTLPMRWIVGFLAFVTVHTAVAIAGEAAADLSPLWNPYLKVAASAFDGLVFVSFYSSIALSDAIAGFRKAIHILGAAVVVHFGLLNLAGETGTSLGLLQPHEVVSAQRDAQLFGVLRPFGLCSEPSFAAGYLFLLSAMVALLAPGRHVRTHIFALVCSVLTLATSLVLFVPLWVLVVLRFSRLRTRLAVVAGTSLLTALIAGRGLADSTAARVVRIAGGQDSSFNQRAIPTIRTILGAVSEAPVTGFGVGQARLADAAGFNSGYDWAASTFNVGSYTGVVAVEMTGDFGVPGFFWYLLLLLGVGMAGRWDRRSIAWAACLIVTQNVYQYRYPQLWLWYSLAVLLCQARRWSVIPAWLVWTERPSELPRLRPAAQ